MNAAEKQPESAIDMVKLNQHKVAQQLAREAGFDWTDDSFAKCVGAIMRGMASETAAKEAAAIQLQEEQDHANYWKERSVAVGVECDRLQEESDLLAQTVCRLGAERDRLTELQADAFENQRQQIEALKSDLKAETAAKEAAEQRADLALKDLAKVQNYGLGCESDYTKLKEEFVAAEAEGGRAVRALRDVFAQIQTLLAGSNAWGDRTIRMKEICEAALSPVPVPAPQTCPTCGHDVRCIHGIDFRDKCEPCEAIESYYEAGPAPTKENQ